MTEKPSCKQLKKQKTELETVKVQQPKSRELYQKLFQHSPAAMVLQKIHTDTSKPLTDFKILEANEAFETMSGFQKKDIIGKTLHKLFPQWSEQIDEHLKALKQPGKSFLPNPTLCTKDSAGQVLWYSLDFFSPEKGYMVTIFQDITPQKKEERLLRIFDMMPSGVILVDKSGHIIFSNKRMTELFGKTQDTLVGKAYADLISLSESSNALERMFQMIHGKLDHISLEREYQRWDGSTFLGHLSGQRLSNPDGTFWALVGVITDITERKKTETALIQSEGQLRTLVNTIPDLIWLKDEAGIYLSCNKTFESFFGAEESDIIGRTDYDFVDKKLGDFFRDHDRKAMSAGQPSTNEEELTFAGNGYRGLFETIKTPMHDTDGNLIGVLGIARDISERKKTEEALLLSRQKLALHSQQTPLAVLELDLEFNIQAWNPSAENIFGFSEQEMLGNNISAIIPKKDWGRIENTLAELLRNKGGTRNTNRNIHKNGDILFCEWFNTPIVNEKGEMMAIVSLGQNITQRMQAEKALRINEERYRELFNTMTSGVAVFTVKDDGETFLFKDLNQAAEQITHRKREMVLGREAADVFPGLMNSGILDGLRRVYRTGKALPLQALFYEDELLSLWVEQNIYKLPSGEIISVFNDVSDKKQIEDTLQVERDKLESVINGMGDILYIVNQNYKIEFQNNRAKESFGTLVGHTCYKQIFKRDLPCEFCRMPDSWNENSITYVETGTVNHKNYEITFSPFQKIKKEKKTVIVLRDITEKKILQADAMRTGHLAALGELAAGVAHEINNPVTGIIGIAEVLSDKFEQLGGDKKIPERIIHEGERISRIVKNLLCFARVKSDDQSLVEINKTLEMTLDLVETQIFRDGIHLSVSLASDIPKIKANDQEIQQVFLNLISNARYSVNKKSPDTSEDKKLEISTQLIEMNQTPYVRVVFLDHGLGISKTALNLITDPFFSTKPPGEGTGLGLSISHGIVKKHGGRLLFESIEGAYAKVMVDLPIHSNPPLKLHSSTLG